MPYCYVLGCKNSASDSKSNGLSFFTFPFNKPDLMKQWLHRIKIRSHRPRATSKICSAHFVENCFKRDLFHELMGQDPSKRRRRRLLHEDAVPTILPPHSTMSTVPTAYSRHIQRKKHRQVGVVFSFFSYH